MAVATGRAALRNATIAVMTVVTALCIFVSLRGNQNQLHNPRGQSVRTVGVTQRMRNNKDALDDDDPATTTRSSSTMVPIVPTSSNYEDFKSVLNIEEYKRRFMTGMHHSGLSFRDIELTLLVGFLTYPGDRARRDVIRETAMKVAKKHYQDLMIWFIMDEAETEEDIKEAMEYDDIIFMRTKKTGRASGFGEKLYTWFEIGATNFTTAFVSKVDADCFLCVHKLMAATRQKRIEKVPMVYWGFVHGKSYNKPPIRIDEQMVVIGHDTASWIAQQGPWPCRLPEFGYGGTSLAQWLYMHDLENPDKPVTVINDKGMRHVSSGKMQAAHITTLTESQWANIMGPGVYVCQKVNSYHVMKDPDEWMKVFQRNFDEKTFLPAWDSSPIPPPP